MTSTLKLVITTPAGKEDQAINEVIDILLSLDENVKVEKTKYPGVIVVYSSLNPHDLARILYTSPTSTIIRIVPCDICVKTSIKSIVKAVLNLTEKVFNSNIKFMVDCIRRGRKVESSLDVEKYVGWEIVRKYGSKVSFSKPDYIVKIEVIDEITCIALLKPDEIYRKKARGR